MKIIDVPSSGKCGITVTFPSRYGLIRRAWVSPGGTPTAYQQAVRSNLATQAHAYRALTAAQQDAWSAAAATQMTRSRLGQNGPLTGLQLFVRINCNLTSLGQAPVTDPPAPPTFAALAVAGLSITNTNDVVAIKLLTTGDPGENTIVRASAPVGSGVRATPQFRLLGTCPTPTTGSAVITPAYVARFGAPPPLTRIFVAAQVMVDGYESTPAYFNALVPASA